MGWACDLEFGFVNFGLNATIPGRSVKIKG